MHTDSSTEEKRAQDAFARCDTVKKVVKEGKKYKERETTQNISI